MIEVELVYALPQAQTVRRLELAPGTTVAEAARRSGLIDEFPELASSPAGIFGQRVEPDHVLKAGDRVEFYRPLTLDPKRARQLRVIAARRRRNG